MAVAMAQPLLYTPAPAAEPPHAAISGPVRSGEVARLVERLAHPSYGERTFATRRLCAIGMEAAPALKQAAASPNVERALRARLILDALEQVLFAGVEVRLALSHVQADWDEPVKLTVILTNRTEYSARVPFELDPSSRTGATPDARQVADLIDVAEWLNVTNDAGDSIPLHVDDITLDAAVSRVIHDRVEEAPYSVLAPGQQAQLVVTPLNRGWARYRMLDAGRFRMVLRYVPEWEDPELAAAKVGAVKSNTVELTITRAAPAEVSRRGAEASIEFTAEDSAYVVRLTNRWDHATIINKNFGPAAPFAQGRWVCERGASLRDIAVMPDAVTDWTDFDAALLVEVPAGGEVELARIERKPLADRFEMLGIDPNREDAVLYFSYTNLCDRGWQARQERTSPGPGQSPDALREPLPLRILTGWHTSNRFQPNRTNVGDRE